MKSCFVLSITKSGTQPSHSSLRVLRPPSPFHPTPPYHSPSPPPHNPSRPPPPLTPSTLFSPPTFLVFSSSSSTFKAILSTFSHLSHIHFPVRPPEDQPPASCMILALILQSPLCIVLIIDDRSSWRYVL